jgi:hypothetical protein
MMARVQTKCWAYLCPGLPTHTGWIYGTRQPRHQPFPIAVCARHAGIVVNRQVGDARPPVRTDGKEERR